MTEKEKKYSYLLSFLMFLEFTFLPGRDSKTLQELYIITTRTYPPVTQKGNFKKHE